MHLPPRWGDDPLSELIKDAFGNILATFVHKPAFGSWSTGASAITLALVQLAAGFAEPV